MSTQDKAAFEDELRAYVGRAVGPPVGGRDPVNLAMIRQWCDAMGEEHPAYLDTDAAGETAHGEVDGENLHLTAPGLEMFVVDGQQWLLENGEIVEPPVLTATAIIARLSQPGVSDEVTTVRVSLNSVDSEAIAAEFLELTGGKYIAKPASPWMQLLIVFGPFVLLILLSWFLISRGIRSAGGGGGMLGNFGKSRHRTLTKEMTGVTFKDVAGIDEAEVEVSEIIE